jgi:Zn finger protein HypA/HybF involved in hydrogenase expression
VKSLEKTVDAISFLCPGCKGNFEFDPVGEYQFVPCPICGSDFMTIKKGQKLLLKPFEFNQEPTKPRNKRSSITYNEMR